MSKILNKFLAQMPTNTIKGNNTGGTANPTDLTGSQVLGVIGTVPIASGGTGQTTAAAGFNALSPMTTSGDIIYGGASGAGTRLPIGSNGTVLSVSSGIPAWQSSAASPTFSTYSLSITSTGTNPTFGTLAVNLASYMTIGKLMMVRFDFKQTSAGSDGSGIWLFSIPGGITIDTTYIDTTTSSGGDGNDLCAVCGTATERSTGFNNQVGRDGVVKVYDSTHLSLSFEQATGDLYLSSFNAGNFTFFSAADAQLSFTAWVPIT